jgi:SWI/SNF-related matrix-associated actin-dependent regulator 1 of chromatin subfamily A
MTDRQKNAAVEAFQHGDKKVFVGQISAAGTGITLTAAKTVLFAELDWVPGNIIQCEDRCHRFGQTEPVRIFHLTAAGSTDAKMIHALVDKQKIIEAVTA